MFSFWAPSSPPGWLREAEFDSRLHASTLIRILFALTVGFQIIFPTISIRLAFFLAIMEGLWLKTKEEVYFQIYRFWLNIFAMALGVSVVNGLVLSSKFGLGFSRFAQIADPAVGPLIAYEVLFSSFLEAGFRGIMIFGYRCVGRLLHFLSTCLVASGTVMSASWILAGNSWMQTPSGIKFKDGHIEVVDLLQVIVNASWGYAALSS